MKVVEAHSKWSPKHIVISKHAKQRIIERVMDRWAQKYIQDIWANGKLLPHEEQKRMYEAGLFKTRYWLSDYRVRDGHIFVFQKNGRKNVLVTVLPTV